MKTSREFRFDGLRLLPGQRLLLRGEQPLKLGSRAFDLLLALIERRGEIVGKDELLDSVWPGQDVGEANLAVQVMALRRLLGAEAITTVPGRGYCFTGATDADSDVDLVEPASRAGYPDSDAASRPVRQQDLFGRATEVQALQALIDGHRLVSIVGPGGVGKTRLAQHLVARMAGRFAAGPWWIELAPLTTPALVAATVAQVLRVAAAAQRDLGDAVASCLRAAPALVVLDNAEHVTEGVAALAATVRERAPQARLLVTSQEPLGLPGEQLLRLSPLTLPTDVGLDSARCCGAVALFEARAQRMQPLFELHDRNCAAVVDICRQLDGLPLAIELAAARLPLLGLEDLRARLGARLKFLGASARPALARHQTLRATLDWSHGLLDDDEQRLFRRLGVFAGGFTLAAAQLAAGDDRMDEWAVLDRLAALVDKSIVVAAGADDRGGQSECAPRFRLLESTRLFAQEQLAVAGEEERMRERHARAMEQLLRVPCDDHRLWRTPPPALPKLADELDNSRAALAWAASADDDELLISLAAGAGHVFLAASLNAEYLQRVLTLRPRVASASPRTQALFWARIAWAASRNAHPAGLDAGLRAAAAYRELGDDGRLYDALTWVLAIASRHGHGTDMQVVIEEATRLENPAWPPELRSSWKWALHRWLQAQGRIDEALLAARRQADLLAEAGHWATHVALGANVADCELTLGRLDRAEAIARAALEALDRVDNDNNLVGHVLDTLMIVLTLKGRSREALDVGRRARRLLQREGDELRLLDTLALNATTDGQWVAAARIAGHAEAAVVVSGEKRWPAAAARRQQLDRALAAALSPEALARHQAEGAALDRDRIFELALGG